jgi:hypothetical protein
LNLKGYRKTGRADQLWWNLTPAANDHTGNFDGQNIQLDLNYGNKIGTKVVFSILPGLRNSEILPIEQEQKVLLSIMPTTPLKDVH